MPLLIVIFLLAGFIASCTAAPAVEILPALVYVQNGQLVLSRDLAADAAPLPFSLPDGCAIHSLHPAPQGARLAILLDCAGGPLTEVIDLGSGKSGRPLAEPIDTRFLSWSADGNSLYLLADSFGDPRILRVDLQHGKAARLPLTGSTYALACSPDSQTLVYAQTPGLGFGSELWAADRDGKDPHLLLAEPAHILALPRWSPDGRRLVYIRMPDTQVPFPNGELWLLDMTDGQKRFLSPADAGHGYAPAWSPDGKFIAFVGGESLSAQDSAGNTRAGIYVLETETGVGFGVSRPENSQAGAPVWSPDGRFIVFPLQLDDKINLWAYEMITEKTIPLTQNGACCPAWIGK